MRQHDRKHLLLRTLTIDHGYGDSVSEVFLLVQMTSDIYKTKSKMLLMSILWKLLVYTINLRNLRYE